MADTSPLAAYLDNRRAARVSEAAVALLAALPDGATKAQVRAAAKRQVRWLVSHGVEDASDAEVLRHAAAQSVRRLVDGTPPTADEALRRLTEWMGALKAGTWRLVFAVAAQQREQGGGAVSASVANLAATMGCTEPPVRAAIRDALAAGVLVDGTGGYLVDWNWTAAAKHAA
jgi:hypothetical protein